MTKIDEIKYYCIHLNNIYNNISISEEQILYYFEKYNETCNDDFIDMIYIYINRYKFLYETIIDLSTKLTISIAEYLNGRLLNCDTEFDIKTISMSIKFSERINNSIKNYKLVHYKERLCQIAKSDYMGVFTKRPKDDENNYDTKRSKIDA